MPDESLAGMTSHDFADQRSETDRRNAETSRQEVAEFKRDAPSPYFAYAKYPSGEPMSEVTTWTGDLLATVLETGEPYYSNFGDRRQSFRARSIDGKTIYSGTAYPDAGDYVRMRAVKPRPGELRT